MIKTNHVGISIFERPNVCFRVEWYLFDLIPLPRLPPVAVNSPPAGGTTWRPGRYEHSDWLIVPGLEMRRVVHFGTMIQVVS